MNKIVPLTAPEEDFLDLLQNYEIGSMVKEIRTQVWVKTCAGYRRIDYVLIIENKIDDRKGLYIEIDDPGHRTPEIMYDDELREYEIFNTSFPLLRFTYKEIFRDTERVMNEIEGRIELMRDA